jgi:DNA repair exonuclease SbcCD ATPase subunit
MPMKPSTSSTLIAASLMLAFATVGETRNMYRYTNADGVTVVDYQVPTDYVARGYEILNDEGVVLEVVPRSLTEEEKKDRNAQQALDAQAKAEEKRLQEWDESLLLRYSTVADIEAAKERALRDLRIRLSILKGNRRSLKQQVENYQAQAADLERSGQTVDVARLVAIEDMQAEIDATERSIADRAQEIEDVSTAYQQDIERFEMLLEVVELRNTLLADQKNKEEQGRDPRR